MAVSFVKQGGITLRRRIVEEMRTAILNGSLRDGERLVERRLAAEFETSLTAVREALIELEAHGFVTKKPNSATYVTKLSFEDLEKRFAVRRVVEGHAAEQAARLATDEQIRALENRYLELLDAARSQDPQLFISRDYLLHEKMWECAQNEYLGSVLHRILVPIFAFTAIRTASRTPFDLLQDAHSHLPVIEAIKSRNPEGAQLALFAALDGWLAKTRSCVFGLSAE